MNIEIREARREDDPAIADLVNRNEPWRPYPLTADALRHGHAGVPRGRPDLELVAWDGRGLVGWGWLRDDVWPAGALMLSLGVLEEHRRRGIGARLLSQLAAAAAGSADEIATRVAEESEAGVAFALAQQFVERYRVYQFVLDLAAFDEAELVGQLLQGAELTLSTLAEQDSSDLRRGIYELFTQTVADVPTPDPVPAQSFEEWEAEALGGSSAGTDIIVLALHAQRPVAMCHLTVAGEGAWNSYTGVARDYRGRGLALAVKREGIRLGRERGLRFIRTENDTLNAGMIAINERLGFRRRPGRIRFSRPL